MAEARLSEIAALCDEFEEIFRDRVQRMHDVIGHHMAMLMCVAESKLSGTDRFALSIRLPDVFETIRVGALREGCTSLADYTTFRPTVLEDQEVPQADSLKAVASEIISAAAGWGVECFFLRRAFADDFNCTGWTLRDRVLRDLAAIRNRAEVEVVGAHRRQNQKTIHRRQRESSEITPAEMEGYEAVIRCSGDYREAAELLGISRSSVHSRVENACRKLGVPKPKRVAGRTQALPSDCRGQTALAVEDDRRLHRSSASIGL